MTGAASDAVASVEVPIAAIVRAVDDHPDFRVIRRIGPLQRHIAQRQSDGELIVCVLDVETTGLDKRNDRITELAVQVVVIDDRGRIVQTGKPRSWLEDPGIPIPPLITLKTGITNEMVRGRSISDGEAYGMIAGADIVLSHNADFDRPFVDRRLELDSKAWICSLNDLDWKQYGFEGRSLGDLLYRCGWFFDGAHRAAADVNALLHLLDHRLDDGETVARSLIRNAGRPTWRIEATGTLYAAKDALKARGYRWDPARKAWALEFVDGDPAVEQAWLAEQCRGIGHSDVRRVTWRERYTLLD